MGDPESRLASPGASPASPDLVRGRLGSPVPLLVPVHPAPSCLGMLCIRSIWLNRNRLHYTLVMDARFSSYVILLYIEVYYLYPLDYITEQYHVSLLFHII